MSSLEEAVAKLRSIANIQRPAPEDLAECILPELLAEEKQKRDLEDLENTYKVLEQQSRILAQDVARQKRLIEEIRLRKQPELPAEDNQDRPTVNPRARQDIDLVARKYLADSMALASPEEAAAFFRDLLDADRLKKPLVRKSTKLVQFLVANDLLRAKETILGDLELTLW